MACVLFDSTMKSSRAFGGFLLSFATAFAVPKTEVDIVGDMTSEGHHIGHPDPEHPAYYLPIMNGFSELGTTIEKGQQPPSEYDVAHEVAVALSRQGYLLAKPGFRVNAAKEVTYGDGTVVRVPLYPRNDRPIVFNRPGYSPLTLAMLEAASGPYSIHDAGKVGPRGGPSPLVQLLRNVDGTHGSVIQNLPDLVIVIKWGTMHAYTSTVERQLNGPNITSDLPGELPGGVDGILAALVAGNTWNSLATWQKTDLLRRTADERYYVIVAAFDFQSCLKGHDKVSLWITKMSVKVNDDAKFGDMIALLIDGARTTSAESARPESKTVPLVRDRRVIIGTPQVVGDREDSSPARPGAGIKADREWELTRPNCQTMSSFARFVTAVVKVARACCAVGSLVGCSTAVWSQTYSTPYTFTTPVGSAGVAGSANGTGSSANFNFPSGVAVDGNGNVYVADQGNFIIRKITPAGVVTTVAGSAGVQGTTDATGAAARFYAPSGVAVDSTGTLYVADYGNNAVRKITPAGVVTTLAGAAAQFNGPYGVAVDSNGYVYVADQFNNTIRKIAPGGAVTTLAGSVGVTGSSDGTGTGALFDQPLGVAVDASGDVYVADSVNRTIREISPLGMVTTLAGSAGLLGSTDGTGSAARFFGPSGVAVDSAGNIYVADRLTIRKITPGGVVSSLAGSTGSAGSSDGTGAAALFSNPLGIAVDGNDFVYIADTGNNTIRVGIPPEPFPVITQQPTNQTATVGTNVTLSVTAPGATGYQWQLNGSNVSGANLSVAMTITRAVGTLTITGVTASQAGNYSVIVMNNYDSIPSNTAVLTVTSAPTAVAPAFTTNPQSQLVMSGTTVAFNSAASGTPTPTYQWKFNGAAISGATSARLVISGATSANAGSYTCVATNSIGSVTSSAGTLTIDSTAADIANPGRMVNLSVNTLDGSGAQAMTVGFNSGGVGTSGSQTLLIRASGPALTAYGVSGVLPDPVLALYNTAGAVVISNSGWASTPGNEAAVLAADSATGVSPSPIPQA